MQFEYYDSKKLVKEFREMGVTPRSHRVCVGCVFSDIPPEYCIHGKSGFSTPIKQSEMLCPHCCDTVGEYEEPLHLHEDPILDKKVRELEGILAQVI